MFTKELIETGQLGVFGTSGGQRIFEYPVKFHLLILEHELYGNPYDLHLDGAGSGSYTVKKGI